MIKGFQAVCPKCGRNIPGVFLMYGHDWLCRDCSVNKSDILKCEKGTRVVFAHPDRGRFIDIENSKRLLKKGKIYTVDSICIDRWYSEISLKEVQNETFNSVQFEMEE